MKLKTIFDITKSNNFHSKLEGKAPSSSSNVSIPLIFFTFGFPCADVYVISHHFIRHYLVILSKSIFIAPSIIFPISIISPLCFIVVLLLLPLTSACISSHLPFHLLVKEIIVLRIPTTRLFLTLLTRNSKCEGNPILRAGQF